MHNHENYGNISIYRDEYGIPHIQGKNYESVCYGSGFAQGQDRLFSMHLKRLFGSGRLSEMAGERAIEIDKFMRNIGLNR